MGAGKHQAGRTRCTCAPTKAGLKLGFGWVGQGHGRWQAPSKAHAVHVHTTKRTAVPSISGSRRAAAVSAASPGSVLEFMGL